MRKTFLLVGGANAAGRPFLGGRHQGESPPIMDGLDFFNGKNLDGWEGLPQYWSVKDGAIRRTRKVAHAQHLSLEQKELQKFRVDLQNSSQGRRGQQRRPNPQQNPRFRKLFYGLGGRSATSARSYWGVSVRRELWRPG